MNAAERTDAPAADEHPSGGPGGSDGSGGSGGSDGSGGPNLGSVARRGFLWQGLAFGLAKGTMLLTTIVAARVLGPDDFGFVSLAIVLVLAVCVVADAGASQALVYLDAARERFAPALLVALASSTVLALAWAALSPVVADQLGRPDDALMVGTLAFVIVLTALGQSPDALLRKELKFSRRLPAEMARGLTRAGVAVGLVLAGVGPWALVWGEVAGAATYAVTSWLMARPRLGPPRTWLARDERRAVLGFGLPVALNGALATAVINVDYVVVGWLLGTTAVGIYLVGFRIPELLVNSVFQVFSQVTYPVYTRLNGDRERLGRAYLLALRVQSLWGLSVGTTVAVLSPVLVPVLFGEQYADSVTVMQAIAAYVVLGSLSTGVTDLFKAVGKPHYGAMLQAARLVVLVPTLVVATQWGLTAVAVAVALVALVFVVVVQRLACRLLGLRWSALAATLRVPVLAAVAAGVVGSLAMVGLAGAPGAVTMVLAGAAAGLATIGVVLVTDRTLVSRVVRG
ncbi:oligosaccharide flippase family protein [Nocardioides sp. HDW12B]|uniref:oligosaccharide flippase family protein n=1 Tax=Nocardioides sp. HDW12B TaxID=2714939 RepID=UPI00140ADD04|nr:oligosaccharide flippase family protein [Nocardioides sp. HDW12B]QIK68263.1 oligosaccharide flippase family protein [Nocardioides sp. HDW12B]